MDWDHIDRYFRLARTQVVGLRPEVLDEKRSGVPCPCCNTKLRPLTLQAVAQVIAQRIFLQHVDECGSCREGGFMRCWHGRRFFGQLPLDDRMLYGRPMLRGQ